MRMRISTGFAIAATALLFGGSAQGSSDQAWAQLDKRVKGACIAMSGLQYPVVSATPIRFSDAIGVEARLVRGYNVVNGRRVGKRLLCAYNRRNGRAEVQEAQAWWAVQ